MKNYGRLTNLIAKMLILPIMVIKDFATKSNKVGGWNF
jgi:hypothetical protein